MSFPNFSSLQKIYDQQMNMLLSSTGLTTKCQLNFGTTKKNLCPNCIYDPGLKKSSNRYKTGGPVPFAVGQMCPYCYGVGFYGEDKSSIVYLAIIADHSKWINPPINVAIPDNMIQTICKMDLYDDLRQCKSMSVLYNDNGANPSYTLYADPTPAGLGNHNYLFAMWKNT